MPESGRTALQGDADAIDLRQGHRQRGGLVRRRRRCLAGDAVKSGLKPGETVNEFLVHDITGPIEDKSLCYRCKYRESPVVCVFARKTVRVIGPSGQADRGPDRRKKELEELRRHHAAERREPRRDLRKLAADTAHQVHPAHDRRAQTVLPTTRISKDADVTVLMWQRHRQGQPSLQG